MRLLLVFRGHHDRVDPAIVIPNIVSMIVDPMRAAHDVDIVLATNSTPRLEPWVEALSPKHVIDTLVPEGLQIDSWIKTLETLDAADYDAVWLLRFDVTYVLAFDQWPIPDPDAELVATFWMDLHGGGAHTADLVWRIAPRALRWVATVVRETRHQNFFTTHSLHRMLHLCQYRGIRTATLWPREASRGWRDESNPIYRICRDKLQHP